MAPTRQPMLPFQSSLHAAASARQTDTVSYLLGQGCEIDTSK